MKKRRSLIEKLVVVSVTVVLCLVLLEIGLRISGRQASNVSEGPYVQYKDFYRFKKNFVKVNDWSTYYYRTITNSYGARDKEPRTLDINDKPYIVFLGASQIFGQGVEFEDSFVGLLAEQAQSRDMEVLNFAVGGQFLLEQEMIFKEFVEETERKPSLVIVGLSSASLDHFDQTHSSQDPIMVKQGYLFYSSSWKKAYVKVIIKNTLSLYDFFRDVFWKLNVRLNIVKYEDRLPKHFRLYERTSRLSSTEEASKTAEHLKQFEEYCSENRIGLAYLFVPLIDSFRLLSVVEEMGEDPAGYNTSLYEDFIVDYCSNNGQMLFNPKALLRAHHEEGTQLMFDRDPHYNEFANKVVGDYLIQEVFVNNELF